MPKVYGTVVEWIVYAERDLNSANYLTGQIPVPFEIICYLCQQSAEKALKGFLIFVGVEFPFTHDLFILNKLCEKVEQSFSSLENECTILTAYASLARYPSAVEIDEDDMKNALADAKKILDFIRNKISAE